jgi:hypothetical protein
MITPKREGESTFFDTLVAKEETGINKTASVEKTASIEKVATMSLFQVRKARRAGTFLKVAGRPDLYQDIQTKDFWKLSDDKTAVVRTFNEQNGLAK